jgi:adenine-specific DNA-methyltransferase
VSPFKSAESWAILSPIEQRLKNKIEAVGLPLKEWDIEIYRGILTGYNDAFIIDGKKKEELIKADPKSAEIIRPILRGRDIKRYFHQFADLWLISTFPSLRVSIDDYPAVKQHLLSFGYDRLKQTGDPGARKKTNNQWFETQDSISYWDDFSKQKIVWMELADHANFYLDTEGYFVNDTVFFLTGDRLLYLLSFLNSRLCEWYFAQIAATSGVGTRRWKKQYIYHIRVPHSIPKKDEQLLGRLAVEIEKKKKLGVDVRTLENEIDEIIFGLFGLSSDEIASIHHLDLVVT